MKGRKSPAPRGLAVALRTAKGRSVASQRWLSRQLNDPYVAAAKQQGWRSRAAFKLAELDERFRLIRRGSLVVDLGAAPGGWTQVAAQRGARVVGVDLLEVDPVSGALLLQGDFTESEVQEQLIAALGGKADLVLSDMAPNTTGHGATDHLRIMALADAALEFAVAVLTEGVASSPRCSRAAPRRRCWTGSSGISPACGTRSRRRAGRNSSELYVVATGFRVTARVSGSPSRSSARSTLIRTA